MITSSGQVRRGAVAARRGIAVSSLVAAAALAAGCGSSGNGQSASSAPPSAAPSSQSPSGTVSSAVPAGSPAVAPTSKSTGANGLAACDTANLSVSLKTNTGGGAAGSTYIPIEFTNTSGSACALYGYPGVSFVTGQNGSQIGAPAKRSGSFANVNVTVAAHATAHAWLQVAEAGNYPASSCHVVSAHFLKVYPPGNTAPAYVSYSDQTCSSAKVVTMTIDPVRTGAAQQGQLP
ncbi:MAG TPA: DUF4232 domain-containing protein [Streptosporangiaceae bacterium]|jgi:hypothetical protein|nr:DUF4232 domain-containing protein [Streptosporangiaceae bacterium]